MGCRDTGQTVSGTDKPGALKRWGYGRLRVAVNRLGFGYLSHCKRQLAFHSLRYQDDEELKDYRGPAGQSTIQADA